MSEAFSIRDLAKRRAKARRIAWALGLIVLAIYVVGMFFSR